LLRFNLPVAEQRLNPEVVRGPGLEHSLHNVASIARPHKNLQTRSQLRRTACRVRRRISTTFPVTHAVPAQGAHQFVCVSKR
jgi:hypothetical protein